MHGLHDASAPSNRPAFLLSGQTELTVEATPLGIAVPSGQLSLSAPADRTDKPHLPVRGDLAHIGLAGRYFVPHYAVPMPRRLAATGALLAAGRADAAVIRTMGAGEMFDVLDIAGNWAWGQAQDDQLVGYVALALLDVAA